jgi:hypothetical protein
MQHRLDRIQMRTLMIGVAAIATQAAFAAKMLAGSRPAWQAFLIVVSGISFGSVLPAIWVAGIRRFGYDGLLTQIAVTGVLCYLPLSVADARPSPVFLILASYLFLAALIPSIAWYMSRTDPRPEQSIRTLRRAKTLGKYAAQFSFGVGFWFFCLIIILSIVR